MAKTLKDLQPPNEMILAPMPQQQQYQLPPIVPMTQPEPAAMPTPAYGHWNSQTSALDQITQQNEMLQNRYSDAVSHNKPNIGRAALFGVAAALLGAKLAGPQGAMLGLMPLAAEMQAKRNRDQAMYQYYMDETKNNWDRGKTAGDLMPGANNAELLRRIGNQLGKNAEGTGLGTALGTGLGSLSDATLKDVLGGLSNSQVLPGLGSAAKVGYQAGYGSATGGAPTGPVQPDASGTLAGGIGATGGLPAFVSDSALAQLSQQVGAGFKEGVGMPKQNADIKKTEAEIKETLARVKYLVASGKRQEAEALYAQLQAKYYPQLVRSIINENNRPPAGRAPSEFETLWRNMSPEQRAMYTQNKAEGSDKTLPGESVNDIINSGQAVGLFDKDGLPINIPKTIGWPFAQQPNPKYDEQQAVLNRLRQFGSGGVQATSAKPAQVGGKQMPSTAGQKYLLKHAK